MGRFYVAISTFFLKMYSAKLKKKKSDFSLASCANNPLSSLDKGSSLWNFYTAQQCKTYLSDVLAFKCFMLKQKIEKSTVAEVVEAPACCSQHIFPCAPVAQRVSLTNWAERQSWTLSERETERDEGLGEMGGVKEPVPSHWRCRGYFRSAGKRYPLLPFYGAY